MAGCSEIVANPPISTRYYWLQATTYAYATENTEKKVFFFYCQFSTNFHTTHQNFRLYQLGMSRLWSATFEQNIGLEYISSTTIKSSHIAADNQLKCVRKGPSLFRYFSWTEMDCARSSLCCLLLSSHWHLICVVQVQCVTTRFRAMCIFLTSLVLFSYRKCFYCHPDIWKEGYTIGRSFDKNAVCQKLIEQLSTTRVD